MTNKEKMIERQKELLRESVISFFLAIVSLVAGHIYYRYSLSRDDFIVLHAGLLTGPCFLFCAIVCFGLWCYFQGYLKHMPDDDPIPSKFWPSNVIPFRRRAAKPPEDSN